MRCFLFLPSYDVMSIMLIWQGIQKNSWVVCHCSRKNEHIFSGVSFIGFTMIQHMQCLHWPDIRFKNKEHIGYIVICFLYAGWVVLIVANYESKQTNYVLLTSLFISLRNYSSLFMPNSAVSIWIYVDNSNKGIISFKRLNVPIIDIIRKFISAFTTFMTLLCPSVNSETGTTIIMSLKM